MTAQNQRYHAALRRRKENERRQADLKAADKTTPVRPAATRTPVRTLATTPLRTVTPVRPVPTTPVKPTVVPPPPVIPVPPPVISTPVTSVLPSVIPTSTLPIPLPPLTTATTPLQSSTNRVIPTPATTTKLHSATPSASPPPVGGVSTGAVVGGIIGGFAALGLIGAALFLFLRRARERKEKNDEIFNAAKFRQSAVVLDDPAEKRSKPRPPTIIEQHVQSRPSPQPSSLPLSSGTHYPTEQASYGVPYGNPSNYGSTYSGSYGVQNVYEQYPQQANAYGYGTSHGYPPHPRYPPQSHYGAHQYRTQQYNAYPPPDQHPGLESDQDSLSLPNPFAALPSPVSENAPIHHSSNTSPASTTRNLTTSTSNQNSLTTEDSSAPPAYEATSKFKNFKADIKATPGLTARNATDDHSGSPTSAPRAPNADGSTPSAPSSHLAPTSATGRAIGSRAADNALPTRPLSGTSAISTVYDLNDAYGGM